MSGRASARSLTCLHTLSVGVCGLVREFPLLHIGVHMSDRTRIGPSADTVKLLMHRALVAEQHARDARNRYHAALDFDPTDVG